MDNEEVREWLKHQQLDGYYISHKAALIASCDPFGLISDYKGPDGTIYGYINGKLDRVDKGEV